MTTADPAASGRRPPACRVLGSRVHLAEDDDRARTVLLSDLHLSDRHCAEVRDDHRDADPLRWFEAVLAATAERAMETRVLILGDLYEFYATDAQLRLPGWRRVAAAIRACVDRGTPVTVLHGNRDFLLGRRFTRASGARVVAGGLSFQLGARRVLGLHGDELCLRDVGYQKFKRVLRHPLLLPLFRVAPPRAALRVAGKLRGESQANYDPSRQSRYDATCGAIDTAFAASGADLLVFGHVHRSSWGDWPLPDGRRPQLVVLPAFDEAGVHLVFEAGELSVRGPDGVAREPFATREFT